MNAPGTANAPSAALSLPPWRVRRILVDDAGLLVVDKPSLVPVHGGPDGLRHAVVDRLGDYLRGVGRPSYLGVHQRLDQDTSGALLFVTEEERNAEVARAVEEHLLRRRYVAVVSERRRLADHGTLSLRLDSDGERARVVTSGGKEAVTRYRVKERNGGRALVELELETGRHHQIRASLAHVGAPVLGDRLYGGAPYLRLCLHAEDLSGGLLHDAVTSPRPAAFRHALQGNGEPAPGDFSAEEVRELLLDAACLRAPLMRDSSAFRLVNGSGDGLPNLVIDAYGQWLAVSVYDDAWLLHREPIESALCELGARGAYLKRRVRADLREQNTGELAPEAPWFGEAAPSAFVVKEAGIDVEVELGRGLSTGLFVDQRDNHVRLGEWARGGKMLNLFCYSAVFSVHAALSGARTTNVDLAGPALARGRRNFELNGLDPAEHRFFKEDAMKYLARAVRRGERYEAIVLDPPSFSTVSRATFSVSKRYEEALGFCLELLAPGGKLLCVTNHGPTTGAHLRKAADAAARSVGRRLRQVKEMPLGLDVPSLPTGPWPSKSVVVVAGD